MKASQITAPYETETIEVPCPQLQANQALVKVRKATICGSDLRAYRGRLTGRSFPYPPGFPGHELVGEVVENNMGDPPQGMPVLIVAPPSQSCGFAEYMAVDPSYLIPLPMDCSPDRLVIAQQLGTVINSCYRLNGVLGLDVVVLGQGPAGLLFTHIVSTMGARSVIGVDLVPSRLRVARSLGATTTLNAEELDVLDAVRELTAGRLADLVIEAVGKTETVNQAMDLVKERGQLLFYGVPEPGPIPVEFSTFFRKRAVAIANVGAQAESGLRSFRLALNMISEGRIDVSQFITHRLPLTQLQAAYKLADARHNVVKVLIEF